LIVSRGAIAADHSDGELIIMNRVYPVHAHKEEEEASEYLSRLTEKVGELMRQRFGDRG
jgi:hypothetical protein